MTQTIEFTSESVIIKQGDIPVGFFLTIRGKLGGNINHLHRTKPLITKFIPGTCFGEIGFFLNCERTATILAETNCSLIFMNRCYHDFFKAGCGRIYKLLRANMGIYIDSMTVHRRRFLRLAVSYLQNMPNQILNELAFQLNVLDYDEGYVIG